MKISVLYRPKSEHATVVESFVRDFERVNTGQKVHLVSLDTKAGDDTARLYDIVEYPAILVTSDDGQMLKIWQGTQLPLMNEVAAYAHS